MLLTKFNRDCRHKICKKCHKKVKCIWVNNKKNCPWSSIKTKKNYKPIQRRKRYKIYKQKLINEENKAQVK